MRRWGEGFIITGTGFHGEDRIQIRKVVEESGAVYNGALTYGTSTHLVCKSLEQAQLSEKYSKAKQWGIPIVDLEWLLEQSRSAASPVPAFEDDAAEPMSCEKQPLQHEPARPGPSTLEANELQEGNFRPPVSPLQPCSTEADPLEEAAGGSSPEWSPRCSQRPPSMPLHVSDMEPAQSSGASAGLEEGLQDLSLAEGSPSTSEGSPSRVFADRSNLGAAADPDPAERGDFGSGGEGAALDFGGAACSSDAVKGLSPAGVGEVLALSLLSRPPRCNTVKARHGLPNLKLVEFAEQVQVASAAVVLSVKDKKLCALLRPYSSDQPASELPGLPSSIVAEPQAFYKLPSGEWWIQFCRMYTAKDMESLAESLGKEAWLPTGFNQKCELLRGIEHLHCPLHYVQGSAKVRKSRQQGPMFRISTDLSLFWRSAVDAQIALVVTDRPASDFVG